MSSCLVPSLTGVSTDLRSSAADTARRAEAVRHQPKPRGLLSRWGHGLLDAAGLVPVVGEVADGLNAVWYAAEGDTVNAALSAAGMVPFLGWGAAAAKFGDEAYALVRRADIPDSVARSAAERFRLREFLRVTEKYGPENVRHLPDGRIRYYLPPKPPRRPGVITQWRPVREFDPVTLRFRDWMESHDANGRVRQIRVEIDGRKRHYRFDEEGGMHDRW